jgi:alpha-1,6-mannosyltransferase
VTRRKGGTEPQARPAKPTAERRYERRMNTSRRTDLPPYRQPVTAAAFPYPIRFGAARIPVPTAIRSTRSGTALTDRAICTAPDLDLFAGGDLGESLDISRSALPARLRPDSLGVLDISEFVGEETGGVRTYLLQKARYVESRPDLRQVLVVPGPRDSIRETGGVRCYQLHGPSIPTQKPYRFMLATRSTSRIVAHEQPDLIEIGSAWFAPWLVHLARRRFRVPAVWFYHCNFPRIIAPRPESAGWLRRASSAAAWQYVLRLSRMVHTTIAPSEAIVRELRAAGVENVVSAPLGVDLEQFNPLRRLHATETRRRLGLPTGQLAMYVGRLTAEKQLDVLLRAWLQVERRTGARLVIVGRGPAWRRLQAGPGGNRVIWLPYQRDRNQLADLYAAVDLAVAPGPAETFGLAALEAMASGNPVLSVDQGGVADTVTRSGAGVLYRLGDSAHLTATAEALLQSDLRTLGSVARRFAESQHSWNAVFDRLFAVYRRVITTAGGVS